MRNIELLAPAGNFECLKAAVYNGANAVYLGGKNFSARAFANNFDEEELKKAVRFAHLHDVRIFVTLNTLLTEKEFANAIKMADFYYERGYQNRDRRKDDQYRIMLEFAKKLDADGTVKDCDKEVLKTLDLDARESMDKINYGRFIRKGWELLI